MEREREREREKVVLPGLTAEPDVKQVELDSSHQYAHVSQFENVNELKIFLSVP